MERLPSLSVVFPAFNDAQTIPLLVKKVEKLASSIAAAFEIIVVNDGSTDGTANALKQLQKEVAILRVITHRQNKGYGAALMSGFKKARCEFIFYTDGDGQYDLGELPKLVHALDKDTDMVTGFKLSRSDPFVRKLVGAIYNQFVKAVFGLKVRDVDCDFRLFKRALLRGFTLKITSGAFDVIFIKSLQDKKVRFKEVGIHHFRRPFGSSQFFNVRSVAKSLWDLVHFVYGY